MSGDELLEKVEYEFRCASADSIWRVHRLSITETISRAYDMRLELVCRSPDANLDGLLGEHCYVTMMRGDYSREVFGIIAEVEYVGLTNGFLVGRVRVVPGLALLEQNFNTRIFEEMSVVDIVTAVLDESLSVFDRSHRWDTSGRGAAVREYCVQYRETDLAFVQRLLEEEGIGYYFEQSIDSGHEILVLTDANEAFEPVATVDGSHRLTILDSLEGNANIESLTGFDFIHSLSSTAVARVDFDWKQPTLPDDAQSDVPDSVGPVRRVYVHQDERFHADATSRRTEDLVAKLHLDTKVGRGRGNSVCLSPGYRFELEHAAEASLSGEYLLLRVNHHGYAPEELLSPGDDDSKVEGERYYNSFECVPVAHIYRPRSGRVRPRVLGPQTAIVCGDGEIHTDEFGRIKVKFHWDAGTDRAQASCWVRVAQSFAGPGWGTQFIPRIGMEVIVEFLEGNPDRPMVTGCVYNGQNSPPFSLPGDKTQSGWRTDSSTGGGGSNEIRFEDLAGSEQIFVHGQKDWMEVIENDTSCETKHDEKWQVGNDQSTSIGHDQTETIGNDQTKSVGSNLTQSVGANKSVTIGSNLSETIGANMTRIVASNKDDTVGSNATQTVASNKSTIVGGTKNVAVGGALTEAVGGKRSSMVGESCSETIVDAKSISSKTFSTSVSDKKSTDVGGEYQLKVEKQIVIATDDEFGLAVKKKAVIEVKDELTIKVGKAVLTMKKNGDITFKSNKLSAKASGDIVMKGKNVKMN